MTDRPTPAPRLRARPIPVTPSLERRFWAKVDRSGGPEACWLWTGGKVRGGYGAIGVGAAALGHRLAHRVAWTICHGPIPVGMLICHRCDVPACCNPAHHFLGTEADNNRDMREKGRTRPAPGRTKGSRGALPRQARGERVRTAKLNEREVCGLRRSAASGVSRKELARLYRLDVHTVGDIIRRLTWKHVA